MLEQLKQNIREEIKEIPREMCEIVMKNVLERARIFEAKKAGIYLILHSIHNCRH